MMNTAKLIKTKFGLIDLDTGSHLVYRELYVVEVEVNLWIRRALKQKICPVVVVTLNLIKDTFLRFAHDNKLTLGEEALHSLCIVRREEFWCNCCCCVNHVWKLDHRLPHLFSYRKIWHCVLFPMIFKRPLNIILDLLFSHLPLSEGVRKV